MTAAELRALCDDAMANGGHDSDKRIVAAVAANDEYLADVIYDALDDLHSCALQAAADVVDRMLDNEDATDGLDIEGVLHTIRHEILTITRARISTFVASDLTLTEDRS